jgi:hypothetical protein
MAWNITHAGTMNNVYSILVVTPGRNGKLERPRCRWEDNIKCDFAEIWVARYHSWLRHYATSWKVSGLFPDEVIRFFS